MNYKKIVSMLGLIMVLIGLSMYLPIFWSVYYGDSDWVSFLAVGTLTALIGFTVYRLTRTHQGVFRNREALVVVTFSWVLASTFGALPFLFSGTLTSFADAFFESMSGFTTTGASVFTEVESLPHGILFWRSLTHWLGGMGIVVLLVAILTSAGVGGMQLFRAESPGPVAEKIKPRISDTAKILWFTYLIFTVVQTLLLWAFGMSLFDALCHTFGSVATGGFSTKNTSLGFYHSPWIYWITIIFMFLSGANFSLYFQALKGKSLRCFWRNSEFKLYSMIVLTAILLIWANLSWQEEGSAGRHFTAASFQVVSMITTTGYASTNFDLWSAFSKAILVLVMFVGGCAGSTGGAIKVGRILVMVKQGLLELRRVIHPKQILTLRISGRVVSNEITINILQFFFIYIAIAALATIIMAGMGLDLVSAFTAVATTLGNTGPGLGKVGPMANFSFIPAAGKYLLSLLMLLGRLELYTVLVLLTPSFWRE